VRNLSGNDRNPGPALTVASGPPFHAEHVGSLLRPAALREAFRAHREGRIEAAEFHAVQDDCIREVIAMQERVGLRAVTDGEFRRASYWAHWVEVIDGLDVGESLFRFHDDAGDETEFTAPAVTGKLERPLAISGAEYDFTSRETEAVVKVTMPSPSTFLFWRGEDSLPEDYATADAFFSDLGRIYREEIADLAARGARYVQLDEVALVMLADPRIREQVEARGEDPNQLVERFVGAINDAVSERPEGMTAAVHVCRGNYKGSWLAEGGYDAIAEQAFSRLDVDALFLEYDTPRAGDFAPLRYVPESKRVVLGLVSSKTADMEDPDELRRRIEAASEHLEADRLGLSPQCGFASAAGGNPITPEAQERKLAMIVEVAEAVWG
jgi:5-methyltetrahydropteroyltriglutamate--homocysteine methyltransferase